MQEIVQLTKDLIRFKSMHSQPAEIMRCAEYIQDYLNRHAIGYQKIMHAGHPSILALPSGNYAPILLMSHMDVVDAPDDMFTPVERDGKIFGRGSIDDKYAVALSLVLLKNHQRELSTKPNRPADPAFGVLITGDEEIGGYQGARPILKTVKTDFGIALDGGRVDRIVTREKGIVRLKLVTRGKSAHGARPWLGENAIEALMADYRIIKTFFPDAGGDHWHRTQNLGLLRAGQSANQVPDSAEALFDIRYTETDDIDAVIERLRTAVSGELTVENKEPLFIGGDSPILDMLLDIAPDAVVGHEDGASDARFLSATGISGIVWGADGNLSQHSANEHVDIDSIQRLYRLLDQLIRSIRNFSTN